MTLHIAAALLVFTVIQLWATSVAIAAGGPRWMPLVGLAVLILGVIPAARTLERRWGAPRSKAELRYRLDLGLLWAGALLVPCAWVMIIGQWFSTHAVTF